MATSLSAVKLSSKDSKSVFFRPWRDSKFRAFVESLNYAAKQRPPLFSAAAPVATTTLSTKKPGDHHKTIDIWNEFSDHYPAIEGKQDVTYAFRNLCILSVELLVLSQRSVK